MSTIEKVILHLCLASTLGVSSMAQGKAVKNIPATSAVLDFIGVPLNIQSDGMGNYPNSATVQSVVQTAGDWILDTQPFNGSATRSVLVDFGDPVAGTGPNSGAPIPPFVIPTSVHGRFIAKCHSAGYDVNMLNMTPGVPTECPLNLAFESEGKSYRIVMNYVGYPDTDPVTITCDAAAGQCKEWTITPYQSAASGKSVGKLLKVATKPRESDQDLGSFRFSFRIKVSIP